MSSSAIVPPRLPEICNSDSIRRSLRMGLFLADDGRSGSALRFGAWTDSPLGHQKDTAMTKKRHCRIDDICTLLLIGAIAFLLTGCGRTTAGAMQPQPPEVDVVTVE